MNTITHLFEEAVRQAPQTDFLRENRGAGFEGTSYSVAKQHICHLAFALNQEGIGVGNYVALLSETRNDWFYSYFSTIYSGAVIAPISTRLGSLQEIAFRVEFCDIKHIFVSGSELKKIRAIEAEKQLFDKVIIFDSQPEYRKNEIWIEDLLKQYQPTPQQIENVVTEALKQKEDDVATLCFTSGTTSNPKAVCETHQGYVLLAKKTAEVFEFSPKVNTIFITPMDHIFAQFVLMTYVAAAKTVASPQHNENPLLAMKLMMDGILRENPELLTVVPAHLKFFRGMIMQAMAAGKSKEEAIQMVLGNNLRILVCGSAHLEKELQEYYTHTLGIPVYIGYGMSESTGAGLLCYSHNLRIGSIGKPYTLDVELLDPEDHHPVEQGEVGEIVMSGKLLMKEYLKNPEATKEILRDGKLYTGDLARTDEDGFYYFVGRIRNLLVAANGEKFSPEILESELLDHSPYIEQLLIHNQQSPYTIALVVPNATNLGKYLAQNQMTLGTEEGNNAAIALLKSELGRIGKNQDLDLKCDPIWLPHTFAIIAEPFSIANGRMNATLKLIRYKICQDYQSQIDYLYTREGENPNNPQNHQALNNIK